MMRPAELARAHPEDGGGAHYRRFHLSIIVPLVSSRTSAGRDASSSGVLNVRRSSE